VSKLVKTLSLAFVVFSFLVIRLMILPGISFNENVWDDEVGWTQDATSKEFFEYIVYRDAPGYFVFFPRLIILLGDFIPSINSISTLRVLVLATQILCFAAAAACIFDFRTHWKSFLLVYISLLMTYVEDLNYVHNVGYLFIFPIFFLVFKPILEGKRVFVWRIGLAALLISKPFTAVIVFALVTLFVLHRVDQIRKLILLGSYSLVYLGTYVFLPNRWETPFNSDPTTIIKAVFDLPWVFFASLNPLVAIGGLRFFRFHDLLFLSILLGVLVYSSMFLILSLHWREFRVFFKQFTLLTKSFILVWLVNFCLVFSASDSFWVKYFPLFRLDSPQFLWMRWSAVMPLSFLLIIASINFVAPKIKFYLLSYISIQWFILILFGNVLKRYW
jgi:hypothetical protein